MLTSGDLFDSCRIGRPSIFAHQLWQLVWGGRGGTHAEWRKIPRRLFVMVVGFHLQGAYSACWMSFVHQVCVSFFTLFLSLRSSGHFYVAVILKKTPKKAFCEMWFNSFPKSEILSAVKLSSNHQRQETPSLSCGRAYFLLVKCVYKNQIKVLLLSACPNQVSLTSKAWLSQAAYDTYGPCAL